MLRVHKSTALCLSYCTCPEHQNTSSYNPANKHVCVFLQNQFFGRSAAKHTGPSVGPERAAEAVKAVRSDRMTSRAAAKTSDVFVGSLQKRISVSARKADGVGPGTVLRPFLMVKERLGSFTQRAS